MMRATYSFVTTRPKPEAQRIASERLEGEGGFVPSPDEPADPEAGGASTFIRGHPWRAFLSGRVERWPTVARLRLHQLTESSVLVQLSYEVRTGFHLVGALEHLVLETEVALLRRELEMGSAPALRTAMRPLRRPVLTAIAVNTTLAVAVIVLVGVLAGFPPPAVAGVALLVGWLDQITIGAFADVVVGAARHLPRLDESTGGLPPL